MRRIALALLTCSFVTGAFAADWPGWRGPDRTGIAREQGLLKTWPKGGPKLLWSTAKIGMGYSSPAVVGKALYILGTDGDKEHLFALAEKDGKQLWKAEIGGPWEN